MTRPTEQREFQAEVKQLLDIVVHSLYTHKDIFLRELISNASDALDKRRFEGLTDQAVAPDEELHIRIDRDAERRTLSVADNGIGMRRDEVVENLGTIAKSGTAEFLATLRESRDHRVAPELIGQFGVGFYSSFMVADRVTVVTRRAGESEATRWESSGQGAYTLSDAERESAGTTITLHLKNVDEENGIRDYTEEWVIREIVKRYSDFVAYPIRMRVVKQETERDEEGRPNEGASPRRVEEDETLNSMKAIWTRPRDEITEQEYHEFYKHITHDWNDPLLHLPVRMEGAVDARAIVYVPSRAPFDLFHREMSFRGLQLYVKRVFIMDECRDLMPPHLRFVRGVIDAEDLSLNISRETLQRDRQIAAIRKFLVRKVMDELRKLTHDDIGRYRDFWSQFGAVLKEGLVSWEEKRESILDLVLAASSADPTQPTTLSDYVGRMRESQDAIYYLTGPSREVLQRSPHAEAFLERGYEVLYFTDPVDEVWLQQPPEFQGKGWRSVGKGDVALPDDGAPAKEALDAATATHKDLLEAIKARLGDRIKDVRLTNRLTSSAACLVGDAYDISPQIAEILRRAGQDVPATTRTLELNPSHPVIQRLQERFARDAADPLIGDYAELLLAQAVLAEGGQLQDPADFSRRLADLMVSGL